MAKEFGINEKVFTKMAEQWIMNEFLEIYVDRHTKAKGLMVRKWLEPE